jgi:hypothetical protein
VSGSNIQKGTNLDHSCGIICGTSIVSNARKLIAKMRRNPRDWRIEDLKIVADSLDVSHDQPGTSHVIFRHVKAGRLSVPAHRPIKAIYVRLFIDFIDRAGEENED